MRPENQSIVGPSSIRFLTLTKPSESSHSLRLDSCPEALSLHPDPYPHHWPHGPLAGGWAYPPKNYDEWSDLIYLWVRHVVDRYGASEVAKREWEVWNEPDIFYWQGTVDEYCKFYDYTVVAVKRALRGARVGGPATTGPANQRAADFLRDLLQHCTTGE